MRRLHVCHCTREFIVLIKYMVLLFFEMYNLNVLNVLIMAGWCEWSEQPGLGKPFFGARTTGHNILVLRVE